MLKMCGAIAAGVAGFIGIYFLNRKEIEDLSKKYDEWMREHSKKQDELIKSHEKTMNAMDIRIEEMRGIEDEIRQSYIIHKLKLEQLEELLRSGKEAEKNLEDKRAKFFESRNKRITEIHSEISRIYSRIKESTEPSNSTNEEINRVLAETEEILKELEK
jgi:methylthioribose-1-phosphate isomerase